MTKDNPALDALLPCPFCGGQPTKGLTKKTGCQMHGDPIQYAIIGCMSCEPKPSFRGGCIYRGGDKPKFKKEAYEEAAIKWNNRANTRPQPCGDAVKALDAYELICSQVPSAEWMDEEMQRASETIRAALSAPNIDFEGLKREIEPFVKKEYFGISEIKEAAIILGLSHFIDHIAAKYPHLRGD